MHHLHMLWFHLESHISFPTIKLWNSGNSSFTFLFFGAFCRCFSGRPVILWFGGGCKLSWWRGVHYPPLAQQASRPHHPPPVSALEGPLNAHPGHLVHVKVSERRVRS